MASAIMHICVAKKVNEYLNMDEKMLYLDTIAPDISKQIGESKNKSHFLKDEDIPDVNMFYNKYKDYLNNPFEMGYYIHLLTDYYWFKEFIPKRIKNIKLKMNNEELKLKPGDIGKIIYSDYTNLNINLIDHYDLTLKLFYEELEYPRTRINEIPINKLKVMVDQMGLIVKNSTGNKTIMMEPDDIYAFLDETSEIIIETIKEERSVIK